MSQAFAQSLRSYSQNSQTSSRRSAVFHSSAKQFRVKSLNMKNSNYSIQNNDASNRKWSDEEFQQNQNESLKGKAIPINNHEIIIDDDEEYKRKQHNRKKRCTWAHDIIEKPKQNARNFSIYFNTKPTGKKDSKRNKKEFHSITVIEQQEIYKILVDSVKIKTIIEDNLGSGLYAIAELSHENSKELLNLGHVVLIQKRKMDNEKDRINLIDCYSRYKDIIKSTQKLIHIPMGVVQL